jgi:uncharacterized protein (TIGR00288 family)
MQNDERRIAVFIDFENVAMGVRESKYGNFDIELVLKRLVEKGKIMVKRAYSDWHRYSDFKRAFHQAAIELIDVPQTRYSGKNSADIRMVVDALDLSYQKDHIDTFVLVSGDSDFSPLVSKLRENGRYVIGMGVKQSSSDLLINNCDEFIFYEDLVRPTTPVAVVDPKLHHLSPKKAEAIRLVLETFQALQREGKEVIYGSMIKQTLIRKLPSFNESYYGYPMFSRLLEDAAENKLLKLAKDQKSGGYIVTVPSEVAPARAILREGAQESTTGAEAGSNGSAGGSAVPLESPDRFRRGRWDRGRPHRGSGRFGEGTQGTRPAQVSTGGSSQNSAGVPAPGESREVSAAPSSQAAQTEIPAVAASSPAEQGDSAQITNRALLESGDVSTPAGPEAAGDQFTEPKTPSQKSGGQRRRRGRRFRRSESTRDGKRSQPAEHPSAVETKGTGLIESTPDSISLSSSQASDGLQQAGSSDWRVGQTPMDTVVAGSGDAVQPAVSKKTQAKRKAKGSRGRTRRASSKKAATSD